MSDLYLTIYTNDEQTAVPVVVERSIGNQLYQLSADVPRYKQPDLQVFLMRYGNHISCIIENDVIFHNEDVHRSEYWDSTRRTFNLERISQIVSLYFARTRSKNMLDMLMKHGPVLRKCSEDAWRFVSFQDQALGRFVGGIVIQRSTADDTGFRLVLQVDNKVVHESPWRTTPFTADEIPLFLKGFDAVSQYEAFEDEDENDDDY